MFALTIVMIYRSGNVGGSAMNYRYSTLLYSECPGVQEVANQKYRIEQIIREEDPNLSVIDIVSTTYDQYGPYTGDGTRTVSDSGEILEELPFRSAPR